MGIVKEGAGTYVISGNDNRITGFVMVVGGRLLVSNDAAAASSGKLPGAIGIGANTTGVVVYTGGCLGGSGSISGTTDVFGHIQPGDDNGRTLAIADYVGGNAIDLKLHPTSRVIFSICDQGSTALDISGDLLYSDRDENYDPSVVMPVLEIQLAGGATLRKGDTFTLISAAAKPQTGGEWNFRIQYPKAYTWEVNESAGAAGYTLTATVVDESYSGQGDVVIEDQPVLSGDNNDFIVDWTADYNDATPLREYASRAGVSIGVAVNQYVYSLDNANDPKPATVSAQFNLVEAENEMKIDATQPSRGDFTLDRAWNLINFANSHDIDVRGHVLVWHQQVSSWISSDGKKNDKSWTSAQLTEIMRDHINGVAGGLKGRVREWDVVNECLDDDQSVVWSNPSAYKLRGSVWYNVIGEEYIEQAFRMAHEVDPDALLFINEYGAEFMGQPKSEAYYNLIKRLVEKGVPIHGVGFQCHFNSGSIDAHKLRENIRRYSELGLICAVTELDIVQTAPSAPDAALRQAEDYCAVVSAALSEDNCRTILIWGLSDPDSWRENNPLLYDGAMAPKEAYYAVHAALRTAAERSGVIDILGESQPETPVEYYNLQGIKVRGDNLRKGIYIMRKGNQSRKVIVGN